MSHIIEKGITDKILDSAEQLFSEKGFEGTSIRELTKKAECNIASVNYHFGNKEKLYEQVFRRRLALLRKIRLDSINEVMSHSGGLEELLETFANAFIEPLIDQSQGRILMKFFNHEMLKPHLSREIFLDEMIKPVMNSLREALKELCPKLDDKSAIMCIHSLVAQLIHVIQVKEMFEGTEGQAGMSLDFGESVKHIAKFTAAGILAFSG